MRATTMKRFFIIILLVCATIGVLYAADQGLTLQEARNQALARSKTLQKLLLSVDSALLDERITSYNWLPSITASASAGADGPSASLLDALGVSAGVSVTQQVFDGGATAVQSAIDRLATTTAREAAREEYLSVLSSADSAYYGVMEAEASLEGAKADLENAKLLQDLAQAKLDAGIIVKSDYLETESETAAKQTALSQAQGKLSVARRTLASLTGLPLPITIASDDTSRYDAVMTRIAALNDAKIESLLSGLTTTAGKNNPSLSQTRLATEEAKKAVDLAAADYLPTVSASWTNSLSYTASTGVPSSALTLSASLPLNIWSTKASVDSKSIASQQASLTEGETQRTLALSIESAVYDIISAAQSVASSQKALEYAQSHYEGVLEQYRLSAASASDLSDAELLVSTNRTALITARFTFLTDISSLRTYCGLESDDMILQMVP